MMQDQIRRLDAHASHLLNGFLDLRAKYALLKPMLLDKDLAERTRGDRVRGFILLRHTLFLSCAQDVAKLCTDTDNRTPSVNKIVDALEDEALRSRLREMFSVREPNQWDNQNNEDDPHIRASLAEFDRRDEEERRTQYDNLHVELTQEWNELSSSEAFQSFRVIRNKVSAHMEIRLVDNEYRAQDIEQLGISFSDLGDTIDSMESIVELIGLTVRSCNFAWDSYHTQMTTMADAFWNSGALTTSPNSPRVP